MRGRVRQRRRQEFPVILFHFLKVIFGKDAVGVQYYQVFSPAAFCAIIACLPRAGIGLGVVADVQNVLITVCDIFAGNGRAVFYDDDFEILETLPGQALQKLVHLVGAVVYGNDNGISHVSVSFYRVTGDDAAKIRFYLVIGCCFAAHSDCYFLCTSFFAKFKNENYLSRCHITGV